MTNINDKIRAKLTKLFALLGSDNVGEREAARSKIDDILRKNQKNWNDLTELLQTGQTAGWDIGDDDPTAAPQPDVNVLALVHHVIGQCVDLQPHEYVAVALWVLHAHLYERFLCTPRLALVSPVRGCGKTTLLALFEKLLSRPHRSDHISPAAIYHLIDRHHYQMLVDEADNLGLGLNGVLRAVINSGHRRGGGTTRLIKGQPRRFSTFAPMAIAAIGNLPRPIVHRSIVIRMQRSDGVKELKRLDAADTVDLLNWLYLQVLGWARSNPAVNPNPAMPAKLRNRQADNWRPLVGIADAFGLHWGKAAREAAIALTRGHHEEDPAVLLLHDIRDVFDLRGVDRLASSTLVQALNEIEDGLWSEWRGMHGDQQARHLSQGELARMLTPFGIRPRTIWPAHRRVSSRSRKGYLRSQFEATWRSYCNDADTPAQSSNIRHLQRA
jgi:Protein of unknown function (DUF3631)